MSNNRELKLIDLIANKDLLKKYNFCNRLRACGDNR